MSEPLPRVSVVIPSWDGAGLLRAALSSIQAQTFTDFETVVVDNGSRDGTAEMLAADFPGVRVIAFPENRGFAVAVNAGVRASRGEIVTLMNNDVEADPKWLATLVNALDRRPDVGSVSSKMLDAANPDRLDTAWDAMSLLAYNVGKGELDGPHFNVGRYVLSACAGAAAYRRSLFDRVGYFDEDFFAWFEDVELGIRCQLAGYRCWYEPAAVVRHRGSSTGARMPDRKVFLLVRNSLILFFQTMPLRRILAWGPCILLWPWLAPALGGGPLRLTLRAGLTFLSALPRVLRNRHRIYASRRVPVADLLAVLESPWDDVRRALRALPQGVSALVRSRSRP